MTENGNIREIVEKSGETPISLKMSGKNGTLWVGKNPSVFYRKSEFAMKDPRKNVSLFFFQ